MTSDPDQYADMDRIKRATDGLMEHFDSVAIFVTRHEPAEKDGTVNASWGAGNWFTRYGQIRTWVLKEEARTAQIKPDNEE